MANVLNEEKVEKVLEETIASFEEAVKGYTVLLNVNGEDVEMNILTIEDISGAIKTALAAALAKVERMEEEVEKIEIISVVEYK